MTAALQRSPLTVAVLSALRAPGQVIGDGELPNATWIGQPMLPGSVFEPFAVLSELGADHAEGPIGAPQGDWRMPYMVEYFGISRAQVSWLADRLRDALAGLRFNKILLGANTYKVQLVRTDSIGQPTQINVTFPSFWHQQDAVTLWMGKEIG